MSVLFMSNFSVKFFLAIYKYLLKMAVLKERVNKTGMEKVV